MDNQVAEVPKVRLHTNGGDGVAKDLERNRFSDR